jgi:hypothetical protein
VTATVVDATSGPAVSPVSATVTAADTAAVGKKSKLLAGADNAGNQTTATCFYLVKYNFLGFQSPIAGSSFKAGSTIPVKFMLANAVGQKIPDAEAKALVSACKATVRLDSGTPGCATYDAKADTFRFDQKTAKSVSVGVHTITVEVLAGADVVNTETVGFYIQ